MPWLEAMLTTLHGMPISAVSASACGTAKEPASVRWLARVVAKPVTIGEQAATGT